MSSPEQYKQLGLELGDVETIPADALLWTIEAGYSHQLLRRGTQLYQKFAPLFSPVFPTVQGAGVRITTQVVKDEFRFVYRDTKTGAMFARQVPLTEKITRDIELAEGLWPQV